MFTPAQTPEHKSEILTLKTWWSYTGEGQLANRRISGLQMQTKQLVGSPQARQLSWTSVPLKHGNTTPSASAGGGTVPAVHAGHQQVWASFSGASSPRSTHGFIFDISPWLCCIYTGHLGLPGSVCLSFSCCYFSFVEKDLSVPSYTTTFFTTTLSYRFPQVP